MTSKFLSLLPLLLSGKVHTLRVFCPPSTPIPYYQEEIFHCFGLYNTVSLSLFFSFESQRSPGRWLFLQSPFLEVQTRQIRFLYARYYDAVISPVDASFFPGDTQFLNLFPALPIISSSRLSRRHFSSSHRLHSVPR